MGSIFLLSRIFVPFVFGACLAGYGNRRILDTILGPIVLGLSVTALYVLNEGLPAMPPNSSKHKLAYALVMVPALAILCRHLKMPAQAFALLAYSFTFFVWLIERQLFSGDLQLHWLLPVSTIVIFTLSVSQNTSSTHTAFGWPVALVAIASIAAAIAFLGGFLGMGQVLLSLVALFGSLTFGIYLPAFKNQNADIKPYTASALWTLQCGLLVMLVQLSTFATNLSIGAYLFLLMLLGLPLIDKKLPPLSARIRPVTLAAISALPASMALFLAIRNF